MAEKDSFPSLIMGTGVSFFTQPMKIHSRDERGQVRNEAGLKKRKSNNRRAEGVI